MGTVTTPQNLATDAVVLCLAFELGVARWKMAFTTGFGQSPRYRQIAARDFDALEQEISAAKKRFDLPPDAPVVSCYEAGRDGFWLARALEAHGIRNLVVDSASIEQSRRKRRAKTDRLDAGKLAGMLLRYLSGDQKVWSVVRVPSVKDEDLRHLHRELSTAKRDRTRLVNRIRSLLFAQGVVVESVKNLPSWVEKVRLWDGSPLPVGLRERLGREWEKVKLVNQLIGQVRQKRRKLMKEASDRAARCAGRLVQLRGIGEAGGWALGTEFFGWREFRNVGEVGALAGLTPTPFQSGNESREQGICKAGNRWIRHLAIELAWGWLRYQPESELSRWYRDRFGSGSARMRRVGIVALARKLLIALWRFVEKGEVPAGAVLKAS